MEVFYWYLAYRNGEEYSPLTSLESGYGTELPQFLVDVDDFVGPLYWILLGQPGNSGKMSVFDKSVYRDPKCDDYTLWDGSDLLEIKRVDPKLIRLLAAVPDDQVDRLASEWFDVPYMTDYMQEGHMRMEEKPAREYLRELVQNLIALARRAKERKKPVMMKYCWATQ